MLSIAGHLVKKGSTPREAHRTARLEVGPGPGTRPREQEGRSADSRPAEPYPGRQYLETAATAVLAGSTNSHNHLGDRLRIWHDWLQLGYRNEFRRDWDRAGSPDIYGAGGRS